MSAALDTQFERVYADREAHLVEVSQPLMLVSQVARSGGTLISQLFDGHPQVHAHPYELHVGHPRPKDSFPELDLSDDPETWYEQLRERRAERMLAEGYTKYARKHGHNAAAGEEDADADEDDELAPFPFAFLPALQRRIFLGLARERGPSTQREVLDCYMTSYFNAWLDNQNLYGPAKRVVTSFAAWMGVPADSRRRLFVAYPDGRFINIVRDPRSWYASARNYNPARFGDVEVAMAQWCESATAGLDSANSDPQRTLVLAFESLISELEPTMRRVADFAGIDYLPSLCEPTFNGMPIKADSSFAIAGHGVRAEPLRRAGGLDQATVRRVDELAGDIPARVAALA